MLNNLILQAQSIWNRLIPLRYVIGFVALYIFILPIVTNIPILIDDQIGESHVYIAVDQRHIIPPISGCITMNWDFSSVRAIYLNNNGIIGPDQQTMCDEYTSLNFRVVLTDETEQYYKIDIYETPLLQQIVLLFVIVGSLSFLKPQLLSFASKLRPYAPLLFTSTCMFFISLALLARAYIAFTTPEILNWDETYYASIASTYANGFGLQPYVQGYGDIPYMGGVGLFSASYSIAYQIIGPYLWALRLVSFLFSVIGLIGIFVLMRKWYGSATGLAAVAITGFLYLFDFTNSIRPDAFGFSTIAWLLFFFALAQDRQDNKRWQLGIGFLFALGLQAHLHTAVVAVACGFVYLIDALSNTYKKKSFRYFLDSPMTAYIMGYVFGFILFLFINVLPNPDGFLRSASVGHLLHTTSYQHTGIDTANVLTSFFSPSEIFEQERIRYSEVSDTIPALEATLWILSLFALFIMRRHPYDRILRILFIGGIIGSAIVLNNQTQYYLAQIIPILSLSLAPFITHGFQETNKVNLSNVSVKSWIILIVFMLGFTQLNLATYQNIQNRLSESLPQVIESPIITQVKSITTPQCHIVGDAGLYVPHFLEYPQFSSTRLTEFNLGSTFYGLNDQPIEYWKQKNPDLIFGDLVVGLDEYVTEFGYIKIAPMIWVKPNNVTTDCTLSYQ